LTSDPSNFKNCSHFDRYVSAAIRRSLFGENKTQSPTVGLLLEANSKLRLRFLLHISNVDGYTSITSLDISGTHQILFCIDVNLLVENFNAVKRSIDIVSPN
jgi:hypothetical protein